MYKVNICIISINNNIQFIKKKDILFKWIYKYLTQITIGQKRFVLYSFNTSTDYSYLDTMVEIILHVTKYKIFQRNIIIFCLLNLETKTFY